MIKSIKVTNHVGESLTLELVSPEKSGLLVRSIEGLGPNKANINITSLASTDGGLFNSARQDTRNIVISLTFLGRPTIEDTRLMTYRYFPLKKKVTLVVTTDNRVAQIEGYVESNDPDIFSKQEGCQISIVCPDPYFYSDLSVETKFSSVEPNFEFPFSNEGLEPVIELGIYSLVHAKSIIYSGDADVGFNMTIHALNEVRNITVANLQTGESMTINTDKITEDTGAPFSEGEDIVICTIRGKKSIYLRREGELINIINAIDKDFVWLTLTAGDNVLSYNAEEGSAYIQFEVEHKVVYEGV